MSVTPPLFKSAKSLSRSNSNNNRFTVTPTSSRTSTTSDSSSFFPTTPPQSQSINNNLNNSPPTRTASRNDIFSLSLPQPTTTTTTTTITNTKTQITPSTYHPSELNRLKASVPLQINSNPTAILGQGTHGTVYLALANDKKTTKPNPWMLCAAKVSNDLSGSIKEALVLERLQKNKTTTKHVASEFILDCFGLKEEEECEWIQDSQQRQQHKRSSSQASPIVLVLEYCSGGDLFKFVQRTIDPTNDSSPFYLDRHRWITWSKQITQALAWCKECHVLVGDLKPQNILITSEMNIKLSDFNCSIMLSPEESKLGIGLIDPQGTGTSVYAAPELVRPPPSPCSYPADIFALGVTMYFMITGREPYRGVQSAVERMLLISRGAFWEHESAIRWRLLDSSSSSTTTTTTTKLANFSTTLCTEPMQYQSNQVISSSTIEALYGSKLDVEPHHYNQNNHTPSSSSSFNNNNVDELNRFQFYQDSSPKIKFLNGSNQFVDESIMILISKMCSPLASHRPSIHQVLDQLNSL